MTREGIVRELSDALTRADESAKTHEGREAYAYGRLEAAVAYLRDRLQSEVVT